MLSYEQMLWVLAMLLVLVQMHVQRVLVLVLMQVQCDVMHAEAKGSREWKQKV